MAHVSNDGGKVSPQKRSMAEFASGAVFGAALFCSGVYAPSIIKSQMTFSSNTMITVMMGGSACSAIIQDLGDRFKLLPKRYPPPGDLGLFPYDANVIGGTLIGLGMGLTGSCPGTALVQAGTGMPRGFIVLAGGLLGAFAFLRFQPTLTSLQTRLQTAAPPSEDSLTTDATPPPKSRDIATALGIQPLVLLLIWVPMCLAVMRLAFAKDGSVRQAPPSGLVAPAYGGLLIGFAQLVTTIVAGHTIGASAAYEDAARWLEARTVRRRGSPPPASEAADAARKNLLTPSVVFSGGVMAAAAILSHLARNAGMLDAAAPRGWSVAPVAALHDVAGGVAMVFGARLAKGCTSGHGISGLARFSLASLVTTAALFSSAIATVGLLGE